VDLTPAEVRVLGSLVEKERTTPEHYPLTSNALIAACNQRTSRDPVTDYDERTVDESMRELRQRGLARTVRGTGMRSYKHRHVLDEALGLSGPELAVIALLTLRGPQTPGELRARTERYAGAIGSDIDATLAALAARTEPLVVNLGRAPGQSQDRWAHLLSGTEAAAASGRAAPTTAFSGPLSARPSGPSRLDELARTVERLEARLARLEQALGVEDDDGDPAG
jgi:uncharacterized protein YceH (UPF0502 family)